MGRWLKNLGIFILVVVGCTAALGAIGYLVRPDVAEHPARYSATQAFDQRPAPAVRAARPHPPPVHVHEPVPAAHESPIFADLVKQKKLPPLTERVPDDPIVMRGCDGIGKYGGTWMRLVAWESDVDSITYRLSSAFLVRWSPLGYPIEPHIAKSVEPSADKREWLITLRPGLKWSDGVAYTADDIVYWWNCEANNKQLFGAPPYWMVIGGKPGHVE